MRFTIDSIVAMVFIIYLFKNFVL